MALCHLAKVCIELDTPDEAEMMLDSGTPSAIRSLGKDPVGVLMGPSELARVLARRSHVEEAEKMSLEIIQAVEKSCGVDHPDYICGLWKLAQLYILQGKRDKAKEVSKTGLERT